MENVPQVCSDKNAKDWESWLQALEMMGYTNYFDVLNAKDYGIPQNRKRCFCVSILGQYGYSFPKRIPLAHRLKDFLDEGISEKYYLKQRIIDSFLKSYVPKEDNYVCDGRVKEAGSIDLYSFKQEAIVYSTEGAAPTMLARDYRGPKKILEVGTLPGVKFKADARVISDQGLAPTLLAGNKRKNILEAIPIPTANSKGFELATEGDGVLPTWKGARGTVQKQSCPTIMTDGNTIGVVVRKESKDDG